MAAGTANPVKVSALPEPIARVASSVNYPSLRFSELESIDEAQLRDPQSAPSGRRALRPRGR
jgi:hypothetical protein